MSQGDQRSILPPEIMMSTNGRQGIDEAVVNEFAAEFAAWRINGCPGYGFAEQFKARLRKAASSRGMNYSTLFSEVHRVAYETIDVSKVADLTAPG